MVRFATAQFRAGHLPLTGWFPYLGLGSPQFLHYQSLPAMLAGALGLLIGPDAAFRWTLYLLLSTWPVAVYLAARLFGAGRSAAGASAAMAPLLASTVGVGYEQQAYLWIGFGVWTQLWASWTLPLAWGASWRAIRDGRGYGAAVVFVALTVALHFETGYLALIPLMLWPFVAARSGVAAGSVVAARSVVRARSLVAPALRAALVLAGALLAAAWVIVPLLAQRDWAATNQVLQGTPLENGYGLLRVLGWLVDGQLLDHGRLPVITAFAAVGVIIAVGRWSRDPNMRALLVALGLCLLLSAGRTTFGALAGLLPGAGDIFFRRFMMGVQLVALLLAGVGAAWIAAAVRRALLRARYRSDPAWAGPTAAAERLLVVAALAAIVAVLAPAWLAVGAYASRNATAIGDQRAAEAVQAPRLDDLLAVMRRDGGGRVYAGMPTNWGVDFTVGAVPVFKFLESRDVDEVGYTLRTASLMTDPEYYFDDRNPGDYRLFGIRWLILPAGDHPPVAARLVARDGPYALWTLRGSGYVDVGTVVGTIAADRTDVGSRSIPLLTSTLPERGGYLRVRFGAREGAGPSALPGGPASPAGSVVGERDEPTRGAFSATVRLRRPGVVVLSSSYDPGWVATVDGRRRPTEMVAPALVAVTVPAGTHVIRFRYEGYGGYPALLILGALTLLVLPIVSRRRTVTRRRAARGSSRAAPPR